MYRRPGVFFLRGKPSTFFKAALSVATPRLHQKLLALAHPRLHLAHIPDAHKRIYIAFSLCTPMLPVEIKLMIVLEATRLPDYAEAQSVGAFC